jgi:N-acetylglutamate synthase-like GNAT family acetyltransferase
MTHEYEREDFLISTDKSRISVETVYNFLKNESYWAKNTSREQVLTSVENSLCYGIYHHELQIGFARVITDMATIAYVADVFVIPPYRGRGLSKWLMQCILENPELSELRRWVLVTRDAQELYLKVGFKALEKPEQYMEMVMVQFQKGSVSG